MPSAQRKFLKRRRHSSLARNANGPFISMPSVPLSEALWQKGYQTRRFCRSNSATLCDDFGEFVNKKGASDI